jgi:CRISPR-associated endonuclease/helicase Cas3
MHLYFAHSTDDPSRADWQPLRCHLQGVGAGAEERGAKFGVSKATLLAGLGHDLGKYTAAFDRRLSDAPERVDHSTAGAQEVMRLAKGPDRGMAELVAYAIAGHHAGLPDRIGASGSLTDRLNDRTIHPLDSVWRSEVTLDATGLFPTSFKPHPDPTRGLFQAGFLGRMIFSSLVDADFRDTEAFYDTVSKMSSERDWPKLPAIIDGLIAAFDASMAEKRTRASETDLNRRRGDILAHVRRRATADRGLFTLTVPTGGGKTLAPLAFALDHAKRHGLDRIVYAIPFTSVIDQTASIFKGILGDVVLEHHSAIEEERLRGREGADKLRLAMEDWAAPVVVTRTCNCSRACSPTGHRVAASCIISQRA